MSLNQSSISDFSEYYRWSQRTKLKYKLHYGWCTGRRFTAVCSLRVPRDIFCTQYIEINPHCLSDTGNISRESCKSYKQTSESQCGLINILYSFSQNILNSFLPLFWGFNGSVLKHRYNKYTRKNTWKLNFLAAILFWNGQGYLLLTVV